MTTTALLFRLVDRLAARFAARCWWFQDEPVAFPEPGSNHTCFTSPTGGGTTIVRVDEAPDAYDDWFAGATAGGATVPARWFMWCWGPRWARDSAGIDGRPMPWTDARTSWDLSLDYGPLTPGETWRAEHLIQAVTR
jgi:hypothetical protein